VLLVELDTQSGKPTKEEGLRVIGNPTRPDGVLAQKSEVGRVGIGTRVRNGVHRCRPGADAAAMGQLTRVLPTAGRGDTGGRGAQPVSRTPKPY
jgi:hypothetical protein